MKGQQHLESLRTKNQPNWTQTFLWLGWKNNFFHENLREITADIMWTRIKCNEIEMLDFTRNNNIVLLCSPPHATK
jgi:hypothetical protein